MLMLKTLFVTGLGLLTLGLSHVIDAASPSALALRNFVSMRERHNASYGRLDLPMLSQPGPRAANLEFDLTKYADDEMWKKYSKVKGEHLSCLMKATDKGAGFLLDDKRQPLSAASQWKGSQEELATWYWMEGKVEKWFEANFERLGLKTAFEGLGVNPMPAFENDGTPADGNNDFVTMNHFNEEDWEDPNEEWPVMKQVTGQRYKVGSKEYLATGGVYSFALNQKDGAIISKFLESPATGVQGEFNWNRQASQDELPELRFASDIFWALWARNNSNVKKLRVYGAYHVVNDDTILLLARAFKNKGVEKLSEWPGASFDADSDEGIALIGSPIGATIAHMLIGHKAELGIKRISKITIVAEIPVRHMFRTLKPGANFFFEIEDVPADKVTPDPEEEKPGERRGRLKQPSESYLGGKLPHVRNKGQEISGGKSVGY